MTSSTPSRGAATWALLSLAIGSFGIGMTEFVIMGLLPNVAGDMLPDVWALSQDDALARTGLLISLYALGVVIGAPTIAGVVAKYPRHRVMIGLAAALTVFNGLTVIAPTFETLAISRVLAGLPHGAYFGIGALVAAEILGPGMRARGVAFMISGLTIANVVGVPLGTFLGQQMGWRAAFGVVAAVFAISALMITFFVPSMAGDGGRTLRQELGVFRIPQVWFTIAIGAIGFGGFFAIYSYIAPIVTDVAGAPEWMVPAVLVLLGVGMTIGNVLGGYFADRNLRRTLVVGLIFQAVVMLLLALASHWIVTLALFAFLTGMASAVLIPSLQTRLMDVAADNQSIGAALNHSSLNIGNSLGAALGGAVIAAGWGYGAPIFVGLMLGLVGLALVLASFRMDRAPKPEPTPVA